MEIIDSHKKELVLYAGTYLNKGGAAIAHGTLKVLKDLGIFYKYIIDPQPFPEEFYSAFSLTPINRYSDVLCSKPISSVNPINTFNPFVKCLTKSYSEPIKKLKDIPIWHIGDSPFSDQRSVLSLIGQVIALKSLKKVTRGKIINGGISLGYPKSDVGAITLRRFFGKDVDYSFIRGKETYATLQKLGVSDEKMSIICDFAFHLDGHESIKSKKIQRIIRESGKINVALILREYSHGEIRTKYIHAIKDMVARLNECDFKVFFVPTTYEFLIPDNDLIFTQSALNINDADIINIKDLTPEEIISLFSAFDIVLSARLHGAVFGALANIPTIHFYEDRKSLEVLSDIFGSYVPLVKLSDFAQEGMNEHIIRKIYDLLENKKKISLEMSSRINDARKESFDKLRHSLAEC